MRATQGCVDTAVRIDSLLRSVILEEGHFGRGLLEQCAILRTR